MAIAAIAFCFTSCDKSDDPEPEDQTTDNSGDSNTTASAIDLGLPSGTLWADRNLGAATQWDYGFYYSWGETEPKELYNWSSYKYSGDKWSTVNKYQFADNLTDACWYQVTDEKDKDGITIYKFIGDGLTTLELADDAARANWGGNWQMPTTEQFQELLDKCQISLVSGIYGDGKYVGFELVGPSGKHLYLPASGEMDGENLRLKESYGFYWTSQLNTKQSYSQYASISFINYSKNEGWYKTCDGFGADRCYGLPIRPVCKKK